MSTEPINVDYILRRLHSQGKLTARNLAALPSVTPSVASISLPIGWGDVSKIWSDVLTTIGSWANMITQFASWTAAQVLAVLTSWANICAVAGLGLIDFATYISNRAFSALSGAITWAQNVFSTWAGLLTQIGAQTYAQILTTLTSWAQVCNAAALGLLNFGAALWTGIVQTANLSWANIVALGAWTTAQITTILTSTANVITALGNWTWAQITATAAQVMTTISTWANILTQVGTMAYAQILTTLTSWAKVTNAAALGLIDFATYISTRVFSAISGTITWAQNAFTTWAGLLTQVGAMAYAQILTTLTSWAQITNAAALGLIDFATYISTRVFSAISGTITWAQNTFTTWAGLLTQLGAQTAAQILTTLTSWATVCGSTALGLLNFASALWTGVIQSANTALTSLADSFFTGVSGLAKFVAGFFTADATGRGKFANLFVNTALIDDLAVSTAKIGALQVTTAKIADLNVTTGKIGDLQVTTAKIALLNVTTALIADLNVTAAKIANATITNAQIASLDAVKITAGYLSAARLDATVAYISATAMIADAIITNAKITALDAAKITTGYLSASRLDVTVAYISASAMIADAIITTAKIGALQVTAAKIANATITDAQIASLDAGKITTGYLNAARLDTAVAYISNTAMIANAIITNLKILDGTIEWAKVSGTFGMLSYYAHNRWITTMEALTGYQTASAGSGAATVRKNYLKLDTGTTSLSYIKVYGYPTVDCAYYPIMKARVRVTARSASGACYVYVGRVESGLNGFGFYFTSTNIYGGSQNGSGTTGTLLISAFNLSQWYVLEARHKGSSIDFYVDGVLRGTLSTYLPTGLLEDVCTDVFNDGDAASNVMESMYFTVTENWM